MQQNATLYYSIYLVKKHYLQKCGFIPTASVKVDENKKLILRPENPTISFNS
jgi:hypothetical protein